MIKLTEEKIRDICYELSSGMRCFYNPESGEVMALPDFETDLYAEPEMWQDISDEIESNIDKLIEFEPLSTKESFQIMADFAEMVTDEGLQSQLIDALNNKKPFGNFKYVVESSGEYRQKWFDFKEQEYCRWIEKQIDWFKDK